MSTAAAEPKPLSEIEVVGGHPAVDFVNTVHDWTRTPPPDYLHDYTDLLHWARRVDLIGPNGEWHLGRSGAAARSRAFGRALALRAELRALFVAIVRGAAWPDSALQSLDELVKETVRWRHMQAEDGRLCCSWDFSGAPPEAVLGPVAWKAAELLESGPLERLRECPGEHCGWLFLDTSKNRSRTWCSMKTCGNTAKVRRFRKRHQV